MLTSGDINASVLKPTKKPTNTDIISIKLEIAKMHDSNPISFTWLQIGVVGENDN